jgi:hypothetical protein
MMRRRAPLLRLLLLVAPLTLGAQCDVTEPAAELTAEDLESARGRWEAAGIDDYTIELEQICFCAFVGRARLTVRNDVVVRTESVQTGESLDPQVAEWLPTVDELFALVDEAIARGAARVDAVYSPSFGYPVSVSLDYRLEVADDEVAYSVFRFQIDRRPGT